MQGCLLRVTPDKGEQPVLWPCRRERGRAEVAARAWPTSNAAGPDATPRPVHRHLPHIHNTNPNLVEHALHLGAPPCTDPAINCIAADVERRARADMLHRPCLPLGAAIPLAAVLAPGRRSHRARKMRLRVAAAPRTHALPPAVPSHGGCRP